MNTIKIWMRAQFFNVILGLLVVVGIFINSIIFNDPKENLESMMLLVFFAYVIISFAGGLPLMLFLYLSDSFFEKLSIPNIRWTYFYLVFSAETFLYASLLLWLLFYQDGLSFTWERLEFLWIALPSTVAMILSVSYEHYQSFKNIQDDPSDSIAN